MSMNTKIKQRTLSPQGAKVVEIWMKGARARLRYLGLLPPLAPGEEDNYSLRIVMADPEKESEPLDFCDIDDEVFVKKGCKLKKRGAVVVKTI